MINVFPGGANWSNQGTGGAAGLLPAVSPQFKQPVAALNDLLLVFAVTTLTGTSPTLQVIVEQLVAGLWQAVTGGSQTAVSATGTYTYVIRGGFGSDSAPYRVRVVDGGTVTAAAFTLSKWAGSPTA